MNILINRNDNLGDIIYTLHLASLLKAFNNDYKIYFLIRDYAKPLFKYTNNIDGTISWNKLEQISVQDRQLELKKFDIFINAKACRKAAMYAKQAGIKTRIGNGNRITQWLYCNKLISIKRKKSKLHEVELNTPFLKPIIGKFKKNITELFKHIKLNNLPSSKNNFELKTNKINIICHATSNGNGREWPIENFISLVKLADQNKYQFILTGVEKDNSILEKIVRACPHVINYAGKFPLEQFIDLISRVDILIASGTGPLHIAAAIGTKTIGLFPPIKAINKERWGPRFTWSINLQADKRCQKSCNNQNCQCMQQLTPELIYKSIQKITKGDLYCH